MDKLKRYLKPTLITIFIVVIYILLISTLNHLGAFTLKTVVTINFVLVSIIMLMLGILKGKKAPKRGYLEGLKVGSLIVFLLFIINVLFFRHFSLYLLLYYAVIVASSTIGSMIGINLKH